MKNTLYLIPKNGSCPVCNAMLRHVESYYCCTDCRSVFKFEAYPDYGGDNDIIVRLLKPKEEKDEEKA